MGVDSDLPFVLELDDQDREVGEAAIAETLRGRITHGFMRLSGSNLWPWFFLLGMSGQKHQEPLSS